MHVLAKFTENIQLQRRRAVFRTSPHQETLGESVKRQHYEECKEQHYEECKGAALRRVHFTVFRTSPHQETLGKSVERQHYEECKGAALRRV